MELLSNLVPAGAPIGMLAAQRNPNTETDVKDALAAADALGRTLHVAKVKPEGGVDAAVAALIDQRVAALFVAPQADFRIWLQRLLELAERHALPTTFSSGDYVRAGGLMSYGADQLDSYRQAGVYAGRIVKGERPADLPVMLPSKFEFVLNRKTARALSLTIPPTLLALANEVIE
jgi:putative ABC transport system substrate-binding protein